MRSRQIGSFPPQIVVNIPKISETATWRRINGFGDFLWLKPEMCFISVRLVVTGYIAGFLCRLLHDLLHHLPRWNPPQKTHEKSAPGPVFGGCFFPYQGANWRMKPSWQRSIHQGKANHSYPGKPPGHICGTDARDRGKETHTVKLTVNIMKKKIRLNISFPTLQVKQRCFFVFRGSGGRIFVGWENCCCFVFSTLRNYHPSGWDFVVQNVHLLHSSKPQALRAFSRMVHQLAIE